MSSTRRVPFRLAHSHGLRALPVLLALLALLSSACSTDGVISAPAPDEPSALRQMPAIVNLEGDRIAIAGGVIPGAPIPLQANTAVASLQTGEVSSESRYQPPLIDLAGVFRNQRLLLIGLRCSDPKRDPEDDTGTQVLCDGGPTDLAAVMGGLDSGELGEVSLPKEVLAVAEEVRAGGNPALSPSLQVVQGPGGEGALLVYAPGGSGYLVAPSDTGGLSVVPLSGRAPATAPGGSCNTESASFFLEQSPDDFMNDKSDPMIAILRLDGSIDRVNVPGKGRSVRLLCSRSAALVASTTVSPDGKNTTTWTQVSESTEAVSVGQTGPDAAVNDFSAPVGWTPDGAIWIYSAGSPVTKVAVSGSGISISQSQPELRTIEGDPSATGPIEEVVQVTAGHLALGDDRVALATSPKD